MQGENQILSFCYVFPLGLWTLQCWVNVLKSNSLFFLYHQSKWVVQITCWCRTWLPYSWQCRLLPCVYTHVNHYIFINYNICETECKLQLSTTQIYRETSIRRRNRNPAATTKVYKTYRSVFVPHRNTHRLKTLKTPTGKVYRIITHNKVTMTNHLPHISYDEVMNIKYNRAPMQISNGNSKQ